MGLYFASPWASKAMKARGVWEQAIQMSAGYHVHVRALDRDGPFEAHAHHRLTKHTDPDPIRAIEAAIAAAGESKHG